MMRSGVASSSPRAMNRFFWPARRSDWASAADWRAREYVHELRPLGANEAVERSGLDQFFDGGTRDDLHVDAIAEVEQIPKRARFTPGPHDLFSGAAAHAFYGGQAKDDLAAGHREFHVAVVH